MVKTFKAKELIEVDRVDSMGDFIPKEVMEKAVQELQERLEGGTPLLVTKDQSNKLSDAQGIVTKVWMDGTKVMIDGTILDTKPGRAVQELMEVSDAEFAIKAIGKPEAKDQVRTYTGVSISGVMAVPKGSKVR